MKEIFSYVAIAGVFLAGIIPLVGLIIHYTKENRRLDKENALKESNGPA